MKLARILFCISLALVTSYVGFTHGKSPSNQDNKDNDNNAKQDHSSTTVSSTSSDAKEDDDGYNYDLIIGLTILVLVIIIVLFCCFCSDFEFAQCCIALTACAVCTEICVCDFWLFSKVVGTKI